MRLLPLPGTALQLSRIAFGTASLHHLLSRRARTRLLQSAYEAGITHFDTSPYYGDGLGELALRDLPRSATIATKVGLYPRGGAHGRVTLVAARRVLARALPALSRPVIDFDVRRAARSLDESCRRLRRDRVDLLLLHEPCAASLATDEWRRWIERERDRVGAFGAAGEACNLLPVIERLGAAIQVIQTRDSCARREAQSLRDAGHVPHITYGHLVARDSNESVVESLEHTARQRPDEVLLVSTRRPPRVAELARAGNAP